MTRIDSQVMLGVRVLLLPLGVLACGPKQTDPETTPKLPTQGPTVSDHEPGAPRPAELPERPPSPETSVPVAAQPRLQNIVAVTDPAALEPVVSAGGDIGTLLSGTPVTDNRSLARKSQRYRAVARVLERDIRGIKRKDKDAGVGIRGNVHRLFDWRWLTSSTADYQLIGIVYRIDRIPTRTDDRCGDVHLIYRLAYTTQVSGQTVSSRLPMTVVLFLPGGARQPDECATAARAWRAPAGMRGRELGQWLVADQGPLGNGALGTGRVERVRVNLQSVRWPSSIRPDLGGHAEYILRSFVPDGDTVKPLPLENTPDVKRLRASRKLRARLKQWIADNLAAIDDGSALVPREFLARRADSVTPRGLSRRANRPYRQIFSPGDLADLPLEGRTFIGSPEALLRRLDDMTCVGCHQSRTIAGFHLLGKDPPDVAPGNALAVYMSSHLRDEIQRRSRILEQVAGNRPFDMTRPFAERGPSDRGISGSRCGLGDPAFASWTCADGLVCDPYDTPDDDRAVGTCLPARSMQIGDPCEFGPLRPNRNSHRDRVSGTQTRTCDHEAVCNDNRVGFPGGMCTTDCSELPEGATCGVIALLHPFNNCLARKTPFPRCLAEHVTPAGLRACDADNPCRDDYICALTPSGQGACMPPYFLFQMRVDGHP